MKLCTVIIMGLLVFTTSCATPRKQAHPEIVHYADTVAAKIKPIWEAEVKERIKDLGDRGLRPIALPSPDNEVLMTLSISKDGEITDFQTAKKSKWAFLNKAAFASIKKASPVGAPPESCIKENVCKLAWKFIVEQ